MRLLLILPVALAAGCTGEPTTPTDTPTDETDATDTNPTDTTDDPTDDPTDTGEPALPRIRALHVGATVPAQDMFGNGNAGQPPLVDLASGEAWPLAGGYATRPAGSYTFSLVNDGASDPWVEFPFTLQAGSAYGVLIFGTAAGPQVLAVEEQVDDLPTDTARVRWTHAAPSLQAEDLELRDALEPARRYGSGTTLRYGETVEADELPATVHLWLDLDGNDACDVGEVFAPFSREGGDYFHVAITEDAEGALLLQGHGRGGQAPQQALAEACP